MKQLDFSGLESSAPLYSRNNELLSNGFTDAPSFDLPVTSDFDGFQKNSIQMVKPAKGTTTLAFIFKDGVMVAADSRASMGGYILPNFGIEPLTGANFASWKDQLLLTLGILDLDYAIRHDEPAAITADSSAAQKADFEKWDRSNRLSLIMIKNSINLSIRGAIPDSDKVKTYIKSVEDHFKGSSKALASNLILQMLTLKYEGHIGVLEHIMKMTDMAHKLKSLEMEVSDNFLVHFIMTFLPARFDAFKVNYNAMKDKWSMSELIAMCVQEEYRLKLGQPESVHLTTATNSKKRKGNHGNKTANKVQKANHGVVAYSSNPLTSKPNCKFCRAKGHGQKDCSKFKEWLAKKGNILYVIFDSFTTDVPINTWWGDWFYGHRNQLNAGIPYNPEATKGPKKT